MGALTFGHSRSCSPLQAAKLLSDTVLLVEAKKLPGKEGASIPEALQQMAEPIRKQCIMRDRHFGSQLSP
jgi:hypothetical protein